LSQPDIIAKLKSGDALVFSEVVNEWQEMVYNAAVSIVQNEADAEDITQDVFVQLHESLADFREEARISTWLYRVTINKSLDHEKKKNRQKRGGFLKAFFIMDEKDEPVHFNHPGVLSENKEKAAVLFNALKKIPDTQRIAFILHKIEGKSYSEIAAITGNTLMAVESLMVRAKTNLKKILKTYYDLNLK
jgi:RNA polymerase sigma-70 factor (ECF subfamily)